MTQPIKKRAGAHQVSMAVALALLAPAAPAGPLDGQVVSGAGTISASGNTTTIQQSTPQLSLTWQSFDIGAAETVNFLQPSATAIAVNRILNPNGSLILGRLNANGQVYLINPNGILFGRDALVNVGGLVASTLDLADDDIISDMQAFSGPGVGSIVNLGAINASDGGHVALLGNRIDNQGVITARLGTVALGAGSAATLTFSGGSLAQLRVDQSVLDSVATNGGLIRADGGRVFMTAGARHALLASVVNNTGVIEARTVEQRGGVIELLGGASAGTARVGGILDASAPRGGDGGFIETSAARVVIADGARITTAAPQGATGTWLIDPKDFTIAAAGGDMTGAALSSALSTNLMIVQSFAGGVDGAGDINVNDTVSWSANRLTLQADNDININAPLNASGSAGLALEYGQAALASLNSSTVNVRAPVNLAAGSYFSTRQGSDGLPVVYTVLTSLGALGSITGADLQGMSGNLTGNYVLGRDIDASFTFFWGGFSPVGSLSAPFTGVFDGLGHDIHDLTVIQSTPDAGLFGHTVAGATLRNVGLVDGSITGGAGTGALVGNNTTGTISNSHSSANVSGGAGSGGLVGSNTSGSISSSYATGLVFGGAGTGGLVGSNTSGSISKSFATGDVDGAAGTGGLVGSNTFGPITDSYATGNVSGDAGTGGLLGSNVSGAINNTYATGSVTGSGAGAGGLIGSSSVMAVTNSYWTQASSGQLTSPGGGTELSSVEVMRQASFQSWDFADTWFITEDVTTPFLLALTTPLTVTANDDVRTYARQTYSGGNGVNYSTTLDEGPVAGTLNYGGTSNGAVNAGTYSILPGGLISDQRYLVSYGAGTLTIAKAVLSATVAAPGKTYDGNTVAAPTLTITGGLVGTETLGVSGTAAFNSKNVLDANLVTVTGTTLANGSNGGLASNYSLAATQTVAASITAKALTAAATAPSKVYDGNAGATPTLSITAGLVGIETVGATGSGSFNTKDVATANVVNVSSTALADGSNGGLASNYSLAAGQTATASITAKALTAAATAPSKVYDGNAGATPTLSITAGLVGIETVGATGSGSFNTKDVATANVVNVTSTALTDGSNGGLAGNYSLAAGQTAAANITVRALTAAALAPNKVYDGSIVAAPTLSITGGLVGTETLGATGTGSFNSKDVASANVVNVTSTALTDGSNGGLAGNYSLAAGQTAAASITARALTAAALAPNKVYDGSIVAAPTLSITGGLVGTETVGATGTGSFNTKDVASANVVSITSATLTDGSNGGLASNYNLAAGQTAAANITPKALSAAVSAPGRVYDGTTTALPTLGITAGLVGAETVGATGTGSFNSKDVASANVVNVTSTALTDGSNGGLAGNYSLAAGQTAAASITARALTAAALAPNKVYDGSIVAAPTLSITGGLVGAETLGATGTGSFNSKDVASANVVNVTSTALTDGSNGGLAGNYSLAAGQTAAASITVRALTAAALAPNKVYDGSIVAAPTLSITGGLVGTETLGATGTGSFNSKDVASANVVNVTSTALTDGSNGGLAGNYSLAAGQTAAASITARALTAAALAPNKVYDGSIVAAPTLSITGGLVGTETVGATGTGSFNTKDVASANVVSITSATLTDGSNGGLASNYNLAAGQTAAANITPKALSAAVSAPGRVYDGTTTALPTLGITAGLVGAETVGATGAGSFNSKNVLTANRVAVTSTSLTDGSNGGLASNYSLAAGQSVAANITPAVLQVSGVTANDKVYDATTAATLGGTATVAAFPGDTVDIGATGTGLFADRNVGNDIAVSVSGFTLGGADAANYAARQPTGLSADIRAAAIAPIEPEVPVYREIPTVPAAHPVPAHLVSTVLAPFLKDPKSMTGPAMILDVSQSCQGARENDVVTVDPTLRIINGGVALHDSNSRAGCGLEILSPGNML